MLPRKVVFFHLLPLEQYPPAMNLIEYLKENTQLSITVITTKPDPLLNLTSYHISGIDIKIIRPAIIKSQSKWRFLNYLIYYATSLFILIFKRPDMVIYFETISSFPAIVYKKYLNKKAKILAHYHEYCTPSEYANNMRLVRWMHQMELKIYSRFSWISQTNKERLAMFRKDIGLNDQHFDSLFFSLPNYPPPQWHALPGELNAAPIKLVYVGSLGLDNMYLKELLEWLDAQNGYFTLDIYAYNIDFNAKEFLERYKKNTYLHFHGGCNYYELPNILPAYDIGIVMYKPFSLNTIHAVSNKIMEYLAFGLDVWFSHEMTHTFEYVRKDKYPKVYPVDFNNLSDFNYQEALNRKDIAYQPSPYNYDTVYIQMKNKLLG